MIKIQEYMTFKIDIGQHISILNRLKRSNYAVYLVFENYAEILELQTVI
jgi:hypothetical protein